MPTGSMDVREIGNVYELKRDQWKGNTAQITKDPELLEKVKQLTWTYSDTDHPYLNNSKTRTSLHKYVLCHIYGEDYVNKMLAAGNIIEHLDNDGLNCTYENLHIISETLNKTKAFSIDLLSKETDTIRDIPPFITDVYYLHAKQQFQMQVFLNDAIYFSNRTGKAIAVFLCRYNQFEDLFIDWFYLLNSRASRFFDIGKFHACLIACMESTYFEVTPEEMSHPMIMREGKWYINLDAKNEDGSPMIFMNHTSLIKFEYGENPE